MGRMLVHCVFMEAQNRPTWIKNILFNHAHLRTGLETLPSEVWPLDAAKYHTQVGKCSRESIYCVQEYLLLLLKSCHGEQRWAQQRLIPVNMGWKSCWEFRWKMKEKYESSLYSSLFPAWSSRVSFSYGPKSQGRLGGCYGQTWVFLITGKSRKCFKNRNWY